MFNKIIWDYQENGKDYASTFDELVTIYASHVFQTFAEPGLCDVYDALMCCVGLVHLARDSEVRGAHPAFEKRLPYLIPDARIIKTGDDKFPSNIYADFWVEVENEVRPVEIKRDVFTKKDVEQLKGYMSRSRSKIGYAVAPKLTCLLPSTMIFIELKRPF